MANWQRRLDIRDVWRKASDGEMTVQELASVIAKRLKALKPFGDEDIDNQQEELVDEFQSFSEDGGSKDEFDSLLNELYDWGDISLDSTWPPKKVCWISTTI